MRRFRWLAVVVLLVVAFNLINRANSRIAFMGDSLTQGWSFPRKNFGVHGQTTAQMVARFAGQIPQSGCREVIILGGTNDTLLGLDPSVTITNLSTMLDLARAEGVKPMLAEIPPIYRDDGRYLPAVRSLDTKIVQLAAAKRVPLIDYYDALDGHPGLYSDGIHLKRLGYLRVEWALMRVENPF